ncbi:MAG: DEAD/DEAH box helicase family protein [Lentisphaeraceae bacterium]|nr:DEAD/DEAH box helicase family protein [Lentisphaeraceae bacterium]
MAVKTKKGKGKESFHKLLVLNQWLISFFASESEFNYVKERLKRPECEGLTNDGQTKFLAEICNYLINQNRLTVEELRRYDLAIVDHWRHITEKRNHDAGHELQMKYFQYLSLLFTEIYLDWYFNRFDLLIKELNEQVEKFNINRTKTEQFSYYQKEELNKLAFWNATGSGKTLLLHVNILQYKKYYKEALYNKGEIDKVIILTPNEGLSNQHIQEANLSGFYANLFDKQTQSSGQIEVIDINKLADQDGDKTIAVEAFEGNNLILIDEGHRGMSGEEWLRRREILCEGGFSFEYSATFGQAVSASGKKGSIAKQVYGKCIIFDYSYKFFYEDGYGKESKILNITSKTEKSEEDYFNYMVAGLLSFYQQIHVFKKNESGVVGDFNLEKPLWVFVGNTVNSATNKSSVSDILSIVFFLRDLMKAENQTRIIKCIDSLIKNEAILLDAGGRNVFEKAFLALAYEGLSADEVFVSILKEVFNSSSIKALHLRSLKGDNGEIALSLGDNEPFGVINIGDASKFIKTCGEHDLDAAVDEFSLDSLFGNINRKDSKINLLVGSKKFTEGWSSWRVSTMGLLNMGKSEGSQIIQLFGRGVRLKGQGYSLKRSRESERPKGTYVNALETLNIFGIKADYMAKFKEYLREEGITPSDEIIEIEFPTNKNIPKNLKTLKLNPANSENAKEGFKAKVKPVLFEVPEELVGKIKPIHINLDLYPKLEALHSDMSRDYAESAQKNEGKFKDEQLAFVDFDKLYLELAKFKAQKNWYNLKLSKQKLESFVREDYSWYTLYIPEKALLFSSFANAKKWQEFLFQLLCSYTEKYYEALKKVYEQDFYDLVPLEENDSNIIHKYSFEVDPNEEGEIYVKRLEELQEMIERKDLPAVKGWRANHLQAICFDKHLFYPLMYSEAREYKKLPLRMRPLGLEAESEYNFIKDLEQFYNENEAFFADKDIYLMRNSSSASKGIGFAKASNFYPDFLLWVIHEGKEYLSFIDPKGIRNMSLDDPKIMFYEEVKNLQKQFDDQMILDSFILSCTDERDLINNSDSKEELEKKHILFQDDGGKVYLKKLFELILA